MKLYSDEKKKPSDDEGSGIDKKFCLEDLQGLTEKDLESKVFVDATSPDRTNLVLDDKLVLNTKFMRVKKKTFVLN